MAGSYDVAVRTLECTRCGAPVASSNQTGKADCRYCGTTNQVTVRGNDRRNTPSVADEVARLSRLKAQQEHPVEGHPYDLTFAPAGSPPNVEGQLEVLRGAWQGAKASAATNQSPAAQRDLLWYALRLADAYVASNQAVSARAVLETALDLLVDPGHRHLARCRLAVEAVREGHVPSAEGWLAECDPAPEVLELDSAWRHALATTQSGKGDWSGVLTTVGGRPTDVPVDRSQKLGLAALRAHALECLGRDAEALASMGEVMATKGQERVLGYLGQNRLAPKLRAYFLRHQLTELVGERNRLWIGIHAVAHAIILLPLIALVAMIPVTSIRCFGDADPFLGAQGYVLCPQLCDHCSGPWRIYTPWSHNNGKHSTGGPRYFCQSSEAQLEGLDDDGLKKAMSSGKLSRNELHVAPAATTYLVLLWLSTLIVPFAAIRRHRKAVGRRQEIDAQLAKVASLLGEPVPVRSDATDFGPLTKAVAIFVVATLVPLAIAAIEIAVR